MKKMLEPNSEKRISIDEALKDPYFLGLPIFSTLKDIKLPSGDSHEFLIKIQQGNRVLIRSNDRESRKSKDRSKAIKRKFPMAENEKEMEPPKKN